MDRALDETANTEDCVWALPPGVYGDVSSTNRLELSDSDSAGEEGAVGAFFSGERERNGLFSLFLSAALLRPVAGGDFDLERLLMIGSRARGVGGSNSTNS